MHWQGVEVIHFAEFTPVNNFMATRLNLTSSEWTALLKLNVNYANLRGVPGNDGGLNGTTLCRRCAKEIETPSHVLWSCPFNSLLINQRHHRIKHVITNLQQHMNFDCFEEVHAIDETGVSRFADIVAFKKGSKMAYILDPTIRFDKNEDQARLVDQEKRNIYEL